MKKIVTHDSRFHTDDVFAVATLLLLLGEAEVVRSRDPEIAATADYLVDTGMKDDPSLRQFDHHQPGGAGERSNGIPYASFGLVWKAYGKELAGGEREAELIDRKLVQPIDAQDNGVSIAEYKFQDVRDYTIGDFLYSFIESREQNHLNTVFTKMVSIAKDLLTREISLAKKDIINEDKILTLYNDTEDKRIVILSEELINWKEVLGKTEEVIYAIHPRPDGHWSLGCVPDMSKPYGVNRKSLPSEWASKRDEELQKITGVEDALFAHGKRFMASAKTKEGAIKLAKLALNA
ncbi:MAG: MYG1 family protein [Minisyncoccia bacterium]